MTQRNKIIYWTATALLSLGMLSGGILQIVGAKWNVQGIVHLGYPRYFLYIIGSWKIVGVIALLIPKHRLLKEWTYAGFFFAMSGAVISHIASGDSISQWAAPFLFLILTLLSWYFRPADRRLLLVTT